MTTNESKFRVFPLQFLNNLDSYFRPETSLDLRAVFDSNFGSSSPLPRFPPPDTRIKPFCLLLFRAYSETKSKLKADYGYSDGVGSSHDMFTKSKDTQQSEAHAS
jgi:hypothetical protein